MLNNYNTTNENICALCGSSKKNVFFELKEVPIFCNLLFTTRQAALNITKGDIILDFCQKCGLIYNRSFNPSLVKYTQSYENALHFSTRFQDYSVKLASYLVNKFDLHQKDIIEFGCGDGAFLSLLCKFGNNRCVGFDPGHIKGKNKRTESINYIADYYSECYSNFKSDFICCRHTLEHIQNPRTFLLTISRAIGRKNNVALFFEVPNASYMLKNLAIWDIIYEHCSYFYAGSLARLFTQCGFRVCDVYETFENQFLCIEAIPKENSSISTHDCDADDPSKLVSEIATFAAKYRSKVEVWRYNLEQMAQIGHRVVVWGAGSKGVSFLNTFKTQGLIEYVVDINPRKQGSYISGSGQQIVAPKFLRDYKPDYIIAMNPVYQAEIQYIVEKFDLTAKLLSD